MRNLRSSAAYRIAFAYAGAYAIGLALLGAVIFAMMRFALVRQLDSDLMDDAKTLAAEYRTGGNRELGEAIAEREASTSSTRMLYAVYAPGGERLIGSFPGPRPPLGLHDVRFIDPREGADIARAATLDLSQTERLVVAADNDWLESIENVVLFVFAIAFVGASLLGALGAGLLGRYLQRRLHLISHSAEAIIGGDIRSRMPVSARRDEFDQLAATLNRMLDRIEGLLENLRQVSSDIAHDLRTPLSQLRTKLEQALDQKGRVEQGVIEDAIRRVDDVLALFAAILRIAEVESGETKRFFRRVDLSALVTELAETFAPSFIDEGQTLLWSIEPGIETEGERELLAQAIINLLENAKHHTPQGTLVRLTLVRAGSIACVGVTDNGPGVPKTDLERVTRRFARLESSRNTAGYGLGLSLVSAVARLHEGRLVLKRLQPGLEAVLELPLDFARTGEPDQAAPPGSKHWD